MQLRLGTRGSPLALWQAGHVRERLGAAGHDVEVRVITTTGDRHLAERLESVGGKGAFLKEIEEGLLAGEIDLAVHSLKDVPCAQPDGLVLAAVLERGDPRDALVSRTGGLDTLSEGAVVGTTSLRRQAQLRAIRPDLRAAALRGNVETRLRRLREGRFDAILLAMAGLSRLGLATEATEILDPRRFVPAPGQGALALECRSDDRNLRELAQGLHHAPSARAVGAERAFLAALGGGCNLPLGAHANGSGEELELWAFVASPDGSTFVRGAASGREPEALGLELAAELRGRGADEILGR